MELRDLDREERLALVALVRAIVLADGKISADEAELVPEIIDALGEASYQEAFARALRVCPDEVALKTVVSPIGRPAARELIYRTIADLARADGLAAEELPLLRWLSSTWKVAAIFGL
jgi:hypothetical protein